MHMIVIDSGSNINISDVDLDMNISDMDSDMNINDSDSGMDIMIWTQTIIFMDSGMDTM